LPAPTIDSAAEPPAWSQAPLFIAQPDRIKPADPMHTERPPTNAPATVSVRDVSAIVPQSNGLFVAQSSARKPQ
jgi:hypothetical protein